MDSIPSPQTILTIHDKLTMAMLPASVKNSQDYDSRDFLFCKGYFIQYSTELGIWIPTTTHKGDKGWGGRGQWSEGWGGKAEARKEGGKGSRVILY